MWMKLLFEAILLLITGSFGLFGNCLIIYWFARLYDKKLNFHYLMMTLAVYDTVYILFCILVFAIPELFKSYNIAAYYCYLVPKAMPIIQVALTGSIYCTGAISVERYLAVCRPFYTARHKWSSKRYVIPIVIFSMVYNLTRFFEMRTTEIIEDSNTMHLTNIDIEMAVTTAMESTLSMNATINKDLDEASEYSGSISDTRFTTDRTFLNERNIFYNIERTSLRKNKYYYSIYTVGLNLILMGIFPFALLMTLNGLLYRELMRILGDNSYNEVRSGSISSFTSNQDSGRNRSRIRNSRRSMGKRRAKRIKPSEIVLGKVSLLIVAVFVFCHSIRWIPNIYELIQRLKSDVQSNDQIEWPAWVQYITNISHFLTVFNSSINFYIYYFNHQGIPVPRCLRTTNKDSANVEMMEQGRSATMLSDNEFLQEKASRISMDQIPSLRNDYII